MNKKNYYRFYTMLNMGIFGTIITHTNTQLDRDNTLRIECVIEFNLMKYSYYEIFFFSYHSKYAIRRIKINLNHRNHSPCTPFIDYFLLAMLSKSMTVAFKSTDTLRGWGNCVWYALDAFFSLSILICVTVTHYRTGIIAIDDSLQCGLFLF